MIRPRILTPEEQRQLLERTDMKRAFSQWWNALTLKGDPQRRPHLIVEAFEAGASFGRQGSLDEINYSRRGNKNERRN